MKRKKTAGLAAAGCLMLFALTACVGSGPDGGIAGGTGQNNRNGTDAAQSGGPARQPADGTKADGDGAKGTGGKTTIVFQTFWPDEWLAQAVKKYEAAHPNVDIKLSDVQTDDSHLEAAIEKFTTTMNTAMLSGSGPDLLEMDLLPTDKYRSRNLLVDYNELMDSDPSFEKDDYFGNILKGAQVGGGLYGMPLSFFLYGLAGDEDKIASTGVTVDDKTWTWNDFIDAASAMVKQGTLKFGIASDPESLLTQMVTDNYSLFVDEKNRKPLFDSDAFTGLMKQVKSMLDEGVIKTGNAIGRTDAYFRPIQINSAWDDLVSLREIGEHTKLYVKPHAAGTDAGGYFRTYRTIGMNAASKVKPEAWAFVKYLMSDELPRKPESAGFPINKKLFEDQLQQLQQEGTVQAYKEGPLHGQAIPVDDTMLEQLKSDVTGATHAVSYQSSQIEDIILDESAAFFSGQKSAEDVAKLIQNRAETYLNE
ncbi:ABC transporter substrate-binding protein [Paenibacillus humicola]|uniref:ABC transporter substrate-binding protein n=1 Tax=Paenibacillus humicola TaxID=3110540 RepID=UPI00237A67AC|nr:extracellular solute-binding protein [Paenibacillus humicola]